eukprot:CAMPEP_0185905938 /NCGR_PEP_ID=MMETSP0196C-20130402/5099_1 /TAXON_ID=2932 /ORGANISM="Alexandrium fundyense, Strain CCMP1719" /LENGTH=61 /DNA_ID=CAMNT_0028625577 /DNA_START=117 /DNA_END=299 /DNA_ORIENTATION=-
MACRPRLFKLTGEGLAGMGYRHFLKQVVDAGVSAKQVQTDGATVPDAGRHRHYATQVMVGT